MDDEADTMGGETEPKQGKGGPGQPEDALARKRQALRRERQAMREDWGRSMAAQGYEIVSRDTASGGPLTIHCPAGAPKSDAPAVGSPEWNAQAERELRLIGEEEKAGTYHVPHPGWIVLFTRAREFAAELRRQEAEAIAKD